MAFLRTDLPSAALVRAYLRQEREEAREPKVVFSPDWTFERFIRENVVAVTADRRYFGRGPRRIRKKKAKAFLSRWWSRGRLGVSMATPIRVRLNYASFGRQIFQVQELPPPQGLSFYDEP